MDGLLSRFKGTFKCDHNLYVNINKLQMYKSNIIPHNSEPKGRYSID